MIFPALRRKKLIRERRNRLSMTASTLPQISPPGAVQYPKSAVLVNKPVTYKTTQIKPAGQVPVMYDETLKMGAPTSTIGPRPISGVPVNSNVRMTTSYSSTGASGNPFIHPTADVMKQTTQVVSPAPVPRYVAPNSDISASKDLYSVNNGQPVNPTLSSGQSSNTVHKGINRLW